MSADLEQFKMKIASYSVEQLEEVLISLNKDKFPEKYQLVRETLANKKGRSGFTPSENLQATVVDSTRAIGVQTPAPMTENSVASPVAPFSPSTPPPSPTPPPSAPSAEVTKPVESIKLSEAPAIPPLTVKISAPPAPPSPAQAFKAPDSPALAEETASKPEKNLFQGFLLFLVLLSTLVAAYCLLLPTMNLPGKALVVDVAQKLPALPVSDLQSQNSESQSPKNKEPQALKNEETPPGKVPGKAENSKNR